MTIIYPTGLEKIYPSIHFTNVKFFIQTVNNELIIDQLK